MDKVVTKQILLIETNHNGDAYCEQIGENPYFRINIAEVIEFDGNNSESFEKIEGILGKNNIDEVVIAIEISQYSYLKKLLNLCEKSGVKSLIIPTYTDYISSNPHMDKIGDVTVIDTRYIPLDNMLNAIVKRSFDIFVSLFGILVLSPVMLIITMIIGKKPIYMQERVGLNKKTFTMYKFRSMKIAVGNDNGWSTKNDDRRTKFGTFIRKTSLDELPQLFNVLKGDMSLVGPRPERPFYVEQFKEEIPKYMIKHLVRPGITGLAQIKGLRGNTSIEERIKQDIYYIENWNLAMDLDIILKTFTKGFINKNAY